MTNGLRISLTCDLTSSKPLQEAKNTIAAVIEKANNEILMKGIPAEKATVKTRITEWRVADKTLTVKIESGTYARAPSALMRFKNVLSEEIGTKHKVGIRAVKVHEFKVTVPGRDIPRGASERIRNIEYVESVTATKEGVNFTLKPMEEGELKRNVPDRVLGLVQGIIEESVSPREKGTPPSAATPVVSKGTEKALSFNEEPAKIGLELGWIKEFPGRGQWIYTTPYAKLIEVIENILVDEVLRKLDFQPFMLPKLIPLEVMKHMPGYLEEIPEGMYYVCHPPREPEAFAKFKEKYKLTKKVPRDILKQVVNDPDYVLAPAQCEPFWQFFSHETLKVEDLPIKLYDRSGWTYRWEGGGVEGLTRIHEFRRIELGYVGTPEQVVNIRDVLRDSITRIVDKILDLEWRIVAAAPFYMKTGEVGDSSESKNVAAFDVEVYLPYRGERERAEWLEIAACFIHKTKFVDSFRIHEAKSRDIWTGCCGIGISRWAAAFLACHGFDHITWPKAIREKFGTYKLPKTLLWPKKQIEQHRAQNILRAI